MAVIVPKLITPPSTFPITLSEAKANLVVTHSDDDGLITALIAAATARLEAALGYAVMPQTWEIALDAFPTKEIVLPRWPVASVSSVKYTDPDGVEQTVSSDDYEVDTYSRPGWVIPISGFAWPTTMETVNAVRVRWVAGAGAEPQDKQAVQLLVAQWFKNRETDTIPPGFVALTEKRKWFVMA